MHSNFTNCSFVVLDIFLNTFHIYFYVKIRSPLEAHVLVRCLQLYELKSTLYKNDCIHVVISQIEASWFARKKMKNFPLYSYVKH